MEEPEQATTVAQSCELLPAQPKPRARIRLAKSAADLRAMLEALKHTLSTVRVFANPREVTLCGINSTLSVVAQLRIPRAAWEDFSVNTECHLVLDLDRLSEILARSDSMAEVCWDAPNRSISINLGGHRHYFVRLSREDVTWSPERVQERPQTTELQAPAGWLKEVVGDLCFLGETLTMRGRRKGVDVWGSEIAGDIGLIQYPDRWLTHYRCDKGTRGEYPIIQLQNWTRYARLAKSVSLAWSNNSDLVVSYQLSDGSTATMWLAARIMEDTA